MKFEQIYNEIIEEGISSILYHHTDMYKLISILKSNVFRLSPVVDSRIDASLNKGRAFYFSTSRTRTASYRKNSLQGLSGISAFITLDGSKLAQRYKGDAVDFYGREDISRKLTDYEQEDRIMSDKSEIPNALSYITKIELFSSRKIAPDEDDIDDFIKYTKGRVPIYFYKDEQSFMVGNFRKALDLRLLGESEEHLTEASIATRRWIAENVPEKYKRPMLALINLAGKAGFSTVIVNSESQVRTIAKLYNVDFVTLMNLVKKLSMFVM